MKDHKYIIAQFTFYDRTGICRLLEKQARKGWLLDKVTNFAWRFRRTEPKDVRFAVTYFPKASAYDPGPSEQQRELIEFCAYSGWVLVGTTAQLQVFYNEAENPVPIDTDPMLELENIHRSAKKNYLPAYIMLLLLALMQIGMQISQLFISPLSYLSQSTTMFNWLCQLSLLTMCVMELGGYFCWYRRAKAAAENGEFVETRGFRNVELVMVSLILAAFVVMLCSMQPRMAVIMGISLGMLFAVIVGISAIQSYMKRRGVSTETNRRVAWVLTILLSVAVTGLAFPIGNKVMELPVWEENRQVRIYEWNGMSFEIYNDDIPLRVEDLTEASAPDYSYEAREQASFLLHRGEYRQHIWESSDQPEMSYIIYTTQIPAIYDLAIQKATEPVDYPIGVHENGELYYEEYIPQDASLWKADTAYRQYAGGEAYNHFVLCYENRVVIFRPDWELTPEQMAAAGEIFGE